MSAPSCGKADDPSGSAAAAEPPTAPPGPHRRPRPRLPPLRRPRLPAHPPPRALGTRRPHRPRQPRRAVHPMSPRHPRRQPARATGDPTRLRRAHLPRRPRPTTPHPGHQPTHRRPTTPPPTSQALQRPPPRPPHAPRHLPQLIGPRATSPPFAASSVARGCQIAPERALCAGEVDSASRRGLAGGTGRVCSRRPRCGGRSSRRGSRATGHCMYRSRDASVDDSRSGVEESATQVVVTATADDAEPGPRAATSSALFALSRWATRRCLRRHQSRGEVPLRSSDEEGGGGGVRGKGGEGEGAVVCRTQEGGRERGEGREGEAGAKGRGRSGQGGRGGGGERWEGGQGGGGGGGGQEGGVRCPDICRPASLEIDHGGGGGKGGGLRDPCTPWSTSTTGVS